MSDPRGEIAAALSSYLTKEQMQKLVDEILAITKRVQGDFHCKKCKQRQIQYIDVPDAKAVASALTDLLNQGYGRAGEASAQGDPIIFQRLTVLEDPPEPTRAPVKPRPGPKGNRKRQPNATVA